MYTNLTLTQAYMAMFRFLEAYYRSKAEPDELAMLLGDMQPLSHLLDRTVEEDTDSITTADPASWHVWLEAVAAILNQGDQESL